MRVYVDHAVLAPKGARVRPCANKVCALVDALGQRLPLFTDPDVTAVDVVITSDVELAARLATICEVLWVGRTPNLAAVDCLQFPSVRQLAGYLQLRLAHEQHRSPAQV